MLENIKDLVIVGALSRPSTARAKITSRPSHTLIYKISGESIYYLDGKQVHLVPDTVLYIPEHQSYWFEKTSEGDSINSLVNFHCESDTPTHPMLFSTGIGENVLGIFRAMERCWQMSAEPSQNYQLISLFYRLLSLLVTYQQSEYMTTSQKMRIEPAMDFLKANMFRHDLKIPELSAACGISDATFRSIFSARFGTSPRKYIIEQRLKRARAILESGEYKNISEIAHSVGYEDELYFSKQFKAFFGISPSDFIAHSYRE